VPRCSHCSGRTVATPYVGRTVVRYWSYQVQCPKPDALWLGAWATWRSCGWWAGVPRRCQRPPTRYYGILARSFSAVVAACHTLQPSFTLGRVIPPSNGDRRLNLATINGLPRSPQRQRQACPGLRVVPRYLVWRGASWFSIALGYTDGAQSHIPRVSITPFAQPLEPGRLGRITSAAPAQKPVCCPATGSQTAPALGPVAGCGG
jgi:hypothetical protein